MKKPTIWLLNYEPGDAVATKAQKPSRTQFNAEFWKRFCEAKIPRKKRLFFYLFWTSKKDKERIILKFSIFLVYDTSKEKMKGID